MENVFPSCVFILQLGSCTPGAAVKMPLPEVVRQIDWAR
jgi:hypothetical protein